MNQRAVMALNPTSKATSTITAYRRRLRPRFCCSLFFGFRRIINLGPGFGWHKVTADGSPIGRLQCMPLGVQARDRPYGHFRAGADPSADPRGQAGLPRGPALSGAHPTSAIVGLPQTTQRLHGRWQRRRRYPCRKLAAHWLYQPPRPQCAAGRRGAVRIPVCATGGSAS